MITWFRNVPWYLGMINIFFISKNLWHCWKDNCITSWQKTALTQISDYHYNHIMIILSKQIKSSPHTFCPPATPCQPLCITLFFLSMSYRLPVDSFVLLQSNRISFLSNRYSASKIMILSAMLHLTLLLQIHNTAGWIECMWQPTLLLRLCVKKKSWISFCCCKNGG